jgi:3-methyladenine DNA glycosylase/8-oxoguanine DNA glycosylase
MRVILPLSYKPPFNWQALLRFLVPRATPGVERAEPEFYRRVLPRGWVEVRPDPSNHHLNATVEAPARDLESVAAHLNRVFDLAAPIRTIEGHLAKSPRLACTVRRESGLRLPGTWDPFELTVRAVLGQQVTVKGATTLTGRLVERFGEQTRHGRLFPRPEMLVGQDLTVIGLPRARAAQASFF